MSTSKSSGLKTPAKKKCNPRCSCDCFSFRHADGRVNVSLVFLILLAIVTLVGSGCYLLDRIQSSGQQDRLPAGTYGKKTIQVIKEESGERITFEVEVASTPKQQEIGLMFRNTLGVSKGMLFSLTTPKEATFWMKNTRIPLDLLFIGVNGKISKIYSMAVPYDLSPIRSDGVVAAVLEIKGGEAARLGIQVGDALQ